MMEVRDLLKAGIAAKLGNALIAPIVAFVPEGDIDPPSSHMKFPGTISPTEETCRRLLVDICGSLRAHGLRRSCSSGTATATRPG
jgi:creatinine amidohydrolase/Fe(II)-dependent formamide hydrolase-like protein